MPPSTRPPSSSSSQLSGSGTSLESRILRERSPKSKQAPLRCCCCCFPSTGITVTTRAHTPDPQAQESQSPCGAAVAVQHNAHNLRTPKHGGRYGAAAAVQHNAHNLRCGAAAVQHNAHNLRTPKHGSRYGAMDGGVADTQPAITQAVSRRRFWGGRRGACWCCCCSTQRAWSPDPQAARGSLSQWTEAWPTQPAITQARIDRRGERGGGVTPPLWSVRALC